MNCSTSGTIDPAAPQALSLINSVVWMSGPVLVSMAAFGTFVGLGHKLTPSVAFPALALFNLLRFPIIMLPTQVGQISWSLRCRFASAVFPHHYAADTGRAASLVIQ